MCKRQVAARDGRWLFVRLLPYSTLENVIDGVALTFMDITVSKMLEAELRQTQSGLEGRVAQQVGQLVRAEDRLQAEIQGRQDDRDAGAQSGPGETTET